MFNGLPKEPPCDDIVILSRSQPIAAIKFGSLSRGSRNSSNNNIDQEDLLKESQLSSEVRDIIRMTDAQTEAKPIPQADSGTFSREDSCERLSSFSDSAENSSTTQTKSGINDLSVFRTTLQDQQNYKKAKKIKVFRNGDKLFVGMNIAVSTDKYKTMGSLLKELTRLLSSNTCLRDGVRGIYSTSGTLVEELEQFLDGECYVATSKEAFIPIDYESISASSWNATSGKSKNKEKVDPLNSILNEKCNLIEENRDFIKPRVITVVQNGSPRNVFRLLLNKKTAFSFEQVLRDINDSVKLDSGAVRKVFTLNGNQITKLSAFFEEDEIFIACGNERLKQISDEDLVYINEKVSIGAKSPVMGRRKSMGAKSPMMSRRGSQPGAKSPQLSRRSSEMSNDFSALKVLDAMRHEDF